MTMTTDFIHWTEQSKAEQSNAIAIVLACHENFLKNKLRLDKKSNLDKKLQKLPFLKYQSILLYFEAFLFWPMNLLWANFCCNLKKPKRHDQNFWLHSLTGSNSAASEIIYFYRARHFAWISRKPVCLKSILCPEKQVVVSRAWSLSASHCSEDFNSYCFEARPSFIYWHEAFISEEKIPYNYTLTKHNLFRIGTNTVMQSNG